MNPVPNWGDVPAWVLVFVSLLGVIAATFAGIYAALIYRIEMRRDRTSQEMKDRSQADAISCWAVYSSNGPDLNLADLVLQPWLHNGSSQPIYDVTIFWYLNGVNVFQDSASVIPPRQIGEPAYSWLVPTKVFSGHYVKIHGRFGLQFSEAKGILKGTRFVIIFTDVEGRQWKRNEHGNLKRT